MKGCMVVGAVLALAAPAMAQNDPVEQRVQRLKQQLQLTDDQTSKAREIYKKQSDDLHAILTDEQKRQYDQPNRGGGNRGGGQNPGGGQNQGGTRTAGLPSTDQLKTQLSLTDDQVTKITAVRDAARTESRNLFRNRQQGGNPLDALNKIRDDTNAKIREVLTDEQKPKFEEIVKASQTPGAPGGFGGFGGTRRGGTLDERVTRVMERLKVEDAKEAEAIKGLVRKVMELMDKLEAYQRETQSKLEEASRNRELSDEAVGKRIEETRTGQRDIEKELGAARKGLAEVVTNRQEVELIRLAVLR